MLTFMTADVLSKIEISRPTSILNLSSFKMGFNRINIAPPYNCVGLDEKMFDMTYAQFLLQDEQVFMELMKIIEPIYQGVDIIILISLGIDWDMITESLQKFLQQRYNIISSICYDVEDYEYGQDLIMTQNSLYNFDNDRKRFINLFVAINGKDIVDKSIKTDDDFIKYNKYNI